MEPLRTTVRKRRRIVLLKPDGDSGCTQLVLLYDEGQPGNRGVPRPCGPDGRSQSRDERKKRMIFAKMRALSLGGILLTLPVCIAADGIREQRVHFKAGSSSAVLTGQIKGEQTVDYVLTAAAGQTMKVSLKTSNASNYFNVLPPGSETAIAIGSTVGTEWSGTLPEKGDYRIRVYLMRNAARRNAVAKYTLSVGITGGAAAPPKGSK